jgi:hypothetical protein
MRQIRNSNLLLLTLVILTSCMDNGVDIIKKRVPVEIYETTIPAIGTVNQDIEIQLKAQATNGCYSDLEIKLFKIDDKHFLFKATGLFDSNGICQDIMVYKDTVINFIPTSTGTYYFQTNESPFEITTQTIEIN